MSGVEQSIPNARDDAAVALVAVALSAGGLAPLRSLVRGLPPDLPAAVVVAQHLMGASLLPTILAADTRMPVAFAESGCGVRQGTIYICPAQQHVIVNPDATFTLSTRERVSFFRPSGDWLFASAAASFRERAIAIVLSGLQNDGAGGAVAIRAAGGTVIAQDLSTCERPEMPAAAIATGCVDFVLSAEKIPLLLIEKLMQLDLQRCRAEWDAPFALDMSAAVSDLVVPRHPATSCQTALDGTGRPGH